MGRWVHRLCAVGYKVSFPFFYGGFLSFFLVVLKCYFSSKMVGISHLVLHSGLRVIVSTTSESLGCEDSTLYISFRRTGVK